MNIDKIKPTAAVALADVARKMEAAGQKVIKLQTGDPDFETHPSVIEAANAALLAGQTHYSFSQGLPALRKQIALQYSADTNAAISEEQVIISHGAAEGFFAVIAALIEPDDEVLLLEPNWPTVDSLVLLMGGVPVKINALQDEDLILEQLQQKCTPKTKILCFNTPNNPTGKVFSQSLIDRICKWAIEKDLFILADEVYRFLQFTKKQSTSTGFLKTHPKYIYINSFSKTFAMTGWRIGYIISDAALVRRILKPSQLAITNVAPFVQMGALTALTNAGSAGYSAYMRSEYEKRRDVVTRHCEMLGLEFIYPDGAFYLFVKLPELNITDVDFCNRLLNDYHTCIVPGSAFGESGTGYIRLSFANKPETVTEGLNQVKQLINELKRT